jgi:hypothetical protein
MFSPVFSLILSFSTLTVRSAWRKIEENEIFSVRAVAGIEPAIISFQTVDKKV